MIFDLENKSFDSQFASGFNYQDVEFIKEHMHQKSLETESEHMHQDQPEKLEQTH